VISKLKEPHMKKSIHDFVSDYEEHDYARYD
jgi:hypothetical protein